MTQHQTETMHALNTDFTVVYIHKGELPVPMGQTNAALRQFFGEIDAGFNGKNSLPNQRVRHELTNADWSTAMRELARVMMRAHAATNGVYAPYRHGFQLPENLVRAWTIQKAFTEILQPLLDNGQLVAVALQGGDDILAGVAQDSDWHWGFGYTTPANPERYAYHFELQKPALATVKAGFEQLSIQAQDLITAVVWADAGLKEDAVLFTQTAERQGLQAVLAKGRRELITIGQPEVAIA